MKKCELPTGCDRKATVKLTLELMLGTQSKSTHKHSCEVHVGGLRDALEGVVLLFSGIPVEGDELKVEFHETPLTKPN